MKSTAQKRKPQKGFTLVEVLVAMTILCVGLLGLASLTAGIMHANNLSKKLTTATTLAQDKMEAIRNLGYGGTPSTDTTTTEAYGSISGYPGYKRVTTIDVDNPSVGIKKVTVEVYWESDTHSTKLETLLAG